MATSNSKTQTGMWERVCAEDDLWEGEMSFHRLGDGAPLILLNVQGKVRAFHGQCPHQENTLEDADFDGEVLTCAAHLWEFDASTGEGINPTDSRLCGYEVNVSDGQIFVRRSGSIPDETD